jgi:hypothetical protein
LPDKRSHPDYDADGNDQRKHGKQPGQEAGDDPLPDILEEATRSHDKSSKACGSMEIFRGSSSMTVTVLPSTTGVILFITGRMTSILSDFLRDVTLSVT